MAVNITADQIVNSNNEAFSFFFTDLQEGQALVFNTANNRWENAFVESADAATTSSATSSATSWAATAPAEEGMVPSELYDATFYGMNSLLFDGTGYLKRTFTGSSSPTSTFSGWIQRNQFATYMNIISVPGGSGNSNITIDGNDKILTDSPGQTIAQSDGVLRDIGWTHVVASIDEDNNHKIYVDGEIVATGTYGTSFMNSNAEHIIGANSPSFNNNRFIGRMANIQFIDGMALDANYFGQNIEGNWAPKSYEGSYGANGFWLDFSKTQWDSVDENTGEPTAASILQTVEDVSGNGNHWQAA